MTSRTPVRRGLRTILLGSAALCFAATLSLPPIGGSGSIGTAFAQSGQGKGGGGQGGGGQGGGGSAQARGGQGAAAAAQGSGQGQGGAGSTRGQGAGQGGGQSSVEHGNRGSGTVGSGEDSDSDRPAWAGTKGGKSGGGTKPSEAGTKKGDTYGDLYVILRDANGVPILNAAGFVQPLDASGNLIPLDAEGAPVDETLLVAVELARLSVGKSPDKVLDRQYTEAIASLNAATSITTDDAGRLVVTNPDGTVATIDSPLANLALYKTLLSQGTLPGLTATDAVLGALSYLKDGQLTVADYKEAAALLAAASDKTVKVTVDTVVDMNTILGVTGTITGADGKTYVSFTNYTYDRAATYPGTVTVLVKNADGTYSKQDVSIMEAVFNNTAYEGTGATAFATAADDARAVILFVHDNPLPTE
ncbi:MAG TPA: hypothetical protein VFN42_08035 [Acetobacteraceae bacterium]|nr:hypothetical protein [Acetobacteraceae bacterium]